MFEESWLFYSQCEPTLWSGGFLSWVARKEFLVLVTEAEASGRREGAQVCCQPALVGSGEVRLLAFFFFFLNNKNKIFCCN